MKILYVMFVLGVYFAVFFSGQVYRKICSRTEDTYRESVVYQYIAGKVRQGDKAGSIRVLEEKGISVLELEGGPQKKEGEPQGERYLCRIYCYEGGVREWFASEDSCMGLEDGLFIVECDGLWFHLEEGLLTVEMGKEGKDQLFLSIRSEEK